MPRPPRTPPRKTSVRGDETKKKLPAPRQESAPPHSRFNAIKSGIVWSSLFVACLLYGLFRLCQTPQDWPTFPLPEVGPWALEQKLYASLSSDRASTLEVHADDVNRHLARHLLAHPAIGARSPALEAIHLSGSPASPSIAARFRWKFLPLHLRAAARRIPKDRRSPLDSGYTIESISLGSLKVPNALKDATLKWFNPLIATLKRERYLLKRSSEIIQKTELLVFSVAANPVSSPQSTPSQPPKAGTALPPSTSTPKASSQPPQNRQPHKAVPPTEKPLPKAERVP